MSHKKKRQISAAGTETAKNRHWRKIAREEKLTGFLPCKVFDVVYGCELYGTPLEKHQCEKLLAMDAVRIAIKDGRRKLIILPSGVQCLIDEMQIGEVVPEGLARLYLILYAKKLRNQKKSQ